MAIGKLVDDSIIVIDSIDRKLKEGNTPRQSAIKGTGEVFLASAAASCVMIAALLPTILSGGLTVANVCRTNLADGVCLYRFVSGFHHFNSLISSHFSSSQLPSAIRQPSAGESLQRLANEKEIVGHGYSGYYLPSVWVLRH